ncbi:MAG: hypothetical protein CMG76_00380 [Candidatus Marinimicrobia bacterium]|nr:hypothetical protein [Candidatus Neomarinimicrobiota bacterium]
MKKILVTGGAGFIGFHLSRRLLDEGYEVYAIDNMNSYYDIELKNKRLEILKKNKNFKFELVDVSNYSSLEPIFSKNDFLYIYHLAAQAGVRYSFENPQAYIDSNIKGFINILELCKISETKKLFYASSSSVYGDSLNVPFKENDKTINPISLYGITKKMNEELAYNYYKLFGLNSIGLRFFTVYGPWGRPDMALFNFTKNIINDKIINVYNHGKHSRSFTFIDDIIKSIVLLGNEHLHKEDFFEIFNIGGETSVQLMDFIKEIELNLNKKAKINFLPKQKGDVEKTCSDSSNLQSIINFQPTIEIEDGIKKFIVWYKKYYNIK